MAAKIFSSHVRQKKNMLEEYGKETAREKKW